MKAVVLATREWMHSVAEAWNRFWFTAASAETLAVIRILAGAMLFYTHLVWTLGLQDFFTSSGWTANMPRPPYVISYFWFIESMPVLWVLHFASLVVFAMMTIGLFTRTTTVLGFLFAASYVNRAIDASFGLDQVNVMLVMYLMLAPCGAVYSVDAWRRRRRGSCRCS